MTIGWDEVGRGLVAGMLERHVSTRKSIARWIGVGLMLGGAVIAMAWGGSVRGLGITMVLVGLIVVLLAGLARLTAMRAINEFASPTTIAEKRDVIDRVSESADLPTGPISIIWFLIRVRRGAGGDVERLDAVMEDLRDELAFSEELAELAEAEPAAGLDGDATPELPE